MVNSSAAAALAAMSVLLSIGSSAGRTSLRGGSARSIQTEERNAADSCSKRLRGSGGGGRKLQAPARRAAATRTDPWCTTVSVPAKAEALEGSYTFQGRFNNGHPVYKDEETGNTLFYDSSGFVMTQPSDVSNFFLFLEVEDDVYEPADLEGLHPWVRQNDQSSCTGCDTSIRIWCTSDAATNSYNSNSPVVGTDGCMNLDIKGGDRTGVYSLNTNAAGQALLRNDRPTYTAAGDNPVMARQVFTVVMDVCSPGYGVVDSAWADSVAQLTSTATVQAVFLMYVARHSDGPADDTGSCEAPVWLLTSGGVQDLETAGEGTFLSLSDVEDPSEATSWAKFTPATATSRATLVENMYIDVGCATGEDAEPNERRRLRGGATGEDADAADGTEPNARRRLRGGVTGEDADAADGTEPNARRRLRGGRL